MGYEVPIDELEIRASRAGGPGGQHVNTSATRVEVRWNVQASPSLTARQRERILTRLESRIGRDGVLRVVAGARRSQGQNRDAAIVRLRDLVTDALHVPKTRRPTAPTKASIEKRLQNKRQRSRRKADRKPPGSDE
jgi:ribosome-associated protein